ncbi:MAG TPA: hypothetical protein VFV38_15275 [Ktedonobacteraceae bacterium]|nr:hypothetical protein [Ktedonobacteraceae bacterium]
MKAPPNRCYLCGAPAIRTCNGCGRPVCVEQQRLGVDAKGSLQYLCIPCDNERQQRYSIIRARR